LLRSRLAGASSSTWRKRAALEARPRIAEVEAGRRIIQYLEETGCRGLIVHTSVPETVFEAARARIRGVKVNIETCPQYLSTVSLPHNR